MNRFRQTLSSAIANPITTTEEPKGKAPDRGSFSSYGYLLSFGLSSFPIITETTSHAQPTKVIQIILLFK
jgi:hypothetical protein